MIQPGYKDRDFCRRAAMNFRIKLDPLDILFSRYICTRAGWKCENCTKQFHPPTAQLQCSHFHGRRKKSIRWDPENAAALCFSCHRFFTENPLSHVEWFIRRLGEKKFDALMLRANSHGKPDKALLKIYFEKALHALEK